MASVKFRVTLKANPTTILTIVRDIKVTHPSTVVTMDEMPNNLLTGTTVITVTGPHTYRPSLLDVFRGWLSGGLVDWESVK